MKRDTQAVAAIKAQLIAAIMGDDELYDALPGDGKDDWILRRICERIKKTEISGLAAIGAVTKP